MPSERQGKLIGMQFQQATEVTSQFSVRDALDGPPLDALTILVEKDEPVVGRFEGDLHFMFGPGLSQTVVQIA